MNLKPEHINVERLQLHGRKGKGNKGRYIVLPPSIVPIFEAYLDYYHPKE